jgi:addiction module HigA family antidote
MPNPHPGEILQDEFLTEFNITATRLAQDLRIPRTRVAAILKGQRRITADTALRLGRYFGNSPQFWLGLQDDYEVEEARRTLGEELAHIQPLIPAAAVAPARLTEEERKAQDVDFSEKLKIGMAEAYRALLAFKKYKQSPVIISRGGRVVAVPPEEMPPASTPDGAEFFGK